MHLNHYILNYSLNDHKSFIPLSDTDILLGNTHTHTKLQQRNLNALNHSLILKHSHLLNHRLSGGIWEDLLKLYILQRRFFFSFWYRRFCSKQPCSRRFADWGTVQIACSKVHMSETGGIVVWASFYPGSMAQRKGWLVCPTSKRCHIFGYRDKSPSLMSKRAAIVMGKRETKPPAHILKWG